MDDELKLAGKWNTEIEQRIPASDCVLLRAGGPKSHGARAGASRAWQGLEHSVDTVERALETTGQVLRHLGQTGITRGPARAIIAYDDVDLTVTITYEGVLLTLPNVGVRKHFLLEEESFSYGLADFLTGVFPDRMEASARGHDVTIRLIFKRKMAASSA